MEWYIMHISVLLRGCIECNLHKKFSANPVIPWLPIILLAMSIDTDHNAVLVRVDPTSTMDHDPAQDLDNLYPVTTGRVL